MGGMNRRHVLKAAGLLGVAAGLSAPALRTASAARAQRLTLYNGQHQTTTDALVSAFTKATGIAVDARKGSGAQLANQIIEEGAASPADLFYAEESPPVAALSEKGLLAKLDEATLGQIPARYAAKDGTWIGASARCRVVAYNGDLINEAAMPASVLDFATEDWDGKVAFVPTSGAFQEQILAVKDMKGRKAAVGWLTGLRQYGSIYNSNSAAMKAVEDGDIATALINNYYWYALASEIGEEAMHSSLFYFANGDAGALVTVSAAGMLKSSKKQNAASEFMAFLVSEEGQKAIVGAVAEYPLRSGVASPYSLKPFEDLNPPAISPADVGDASDALVLMREAGLA